MKSERRHELERNELADWLGEILAKVKPYQNLILAVLLLAVVSVGCYTWWIRQTATKTAAGWNQFYRAFTQQAVTPANFDQIAEQYPGTQVGHWAATLAADLHLNAGCNLLFYNKANANQELRQAVEYYVTVREQSRQPMLLERATYGLARALEAQGDLEQAVARYEDIVQSWPDGAYAAQAARRAEQLKQPATKAWYDRFAKFDPQTEFSSEPGTPGQKPLFDLDTLSDDGSLFTPAMDLDLEEEPPAGADDGAIEPPALPDDDPPRESTPDDTKREPPKTADESTN